MTEGTARWKCEATADRLFDKTYDYNCGICAACLREQEQESQDNQESE